MSAMRRVEGGGEGGGGGREREREGGGREREGGGREREIYFKIAGETGNEASVVTICTCD